MKTKIILLILTISSVCTAQYDKLPHFSDSLTMYKSTFSEIDFNGKKSYIPEVTFTFSKDKVLTTLKDQMKDFKTFEIVNYGNDENQIWQTYKCYDNSNSISYLSLCYDKEFNTQVIIINYGNLLMFFEVNEYPIPPKAYDIFDHLEEYGYTTDGYKGDEYTNEEVREFLSQFGDPDLLIKLMVISLYKKDEKKK